MIRYILPLGLLVLAGCSQQVGDMACSDIAAEAVRISKGNLIKIMQQTTVSRDKRETVCRGIGVYNDIGEVPTRFRIYLDQENQPMVKYDTEEAQAAALSAAEREINREVERATRGY